MKSDVDRVMTLSELESQDWGPPTFASHLVSTIHRLRHKPLGQFTIEDLRIIIGQNIGLEYLVPIAIERLQEDPFVEGDFYRGDLLVSVLRIERQFWSKHSELRHMVAEIADQVPARSQQLETIDRETLDEALSGFMLFDPNA